MGLEQGDTGIIGGGSSDPAGVITDGSGNRRLQVQATVVNGVPAGDFFRGPLENGGSDNQVVNGSGTPVVFSVTADPTNDIVIAELRIVFSADGIDWDGNSFGKGSALSNGILIELVDGGVTKEIGNIQINEDWLLLPARTGVTIDQVSATGVLAISVDFGAGVTLDAGSGDLLRSTIRDNLTSGPRQINSLRMIAFGVEV